MRRMSVFYGSVCQCTYKLLEAKWTLLAN